MDGSCSSQPIKSSRGRVVLWTKADSITYFDQLVISLLP
jgi:hypothetical protein